MNKKSQVLVDDIIYISENIQEKESFKSDIKCLLDLYKIGAVSDQLLEYKLTILVKECRELYDDLIK